MSLSTSDPVVLAPSRRQLVSAPARRWWQTSLRWLAYGLFALWSVLLLAWLTLHWGILPHIDDWRPRIEALATRSVGAPVRIGRIQVKEGGWVPAMELLDVQLMDPQGRSALRLPRVAAALSVPALLALELRFEQLLIEDPELDIRRDASGRIFVGGLDLGAGGSGGEGAADWFFEQHEFVIRGATLRWLDEQRAAPPLALTGVQLVIRNGLRRHDLRLDATLPEGWGERFSLRARLRQPLLARAADFSQWSGTLHADLPHAEVAQLRHYVNLPLALAEGSGAMRLWLDLDQGQPRTGTADLALRDVTLRLSPQLAPMNFTQMQGRFEAQQSAQQWRVAASQFGFVTGDGRQWPAGRMALSLNRAPVPSKAPPASATAWLGGPLAGGEFSADRLDLPVLASLAERLPLGDGVRRLLAGMAPQGGIQDLALRWDGPLDAPRQYQASARFKGVSIASAPSPEARGIGRPGVRQADIDLNATETGGEARLVVAGGALDFPGVFEQPVVPLTRLDSQLQWRITPAGAAGGAPQVALQVKEARFENDEVKGELNATWHTGAATTFGKGGRLPGVLDMSGKLLRGKATAVARYLPLGIPAAARHYVQNAVQAGKVESATFKVKGDLWNFPFYNAKEGEFNIAGQVRDVQLAYVPSTPADPATREPAWASPWPAFTQVQGELVFDRVSMSIRNAQGRLWGTELRNVNGGISDFAEGAPVRIDGQARGPAGDLLRYLNATPVGEWTQHMLAQASAAGPAELNLSLTLPLTKLSASTVKGSVQLLGGDVRIQPGTPLLAGARGRVDFSHKGFAIVGGAARVAGGDASFDGGSQPDGSLRFTGQGTATADGLRRLPELGPVARAAQLMSGSAPYKLQLGYVKGWQELNVSSPLTGMAIDLPAPLGKAAEAPGLLRLSSTLLPDSLAPGQTPRDLLKLELGPSFHAQFQRELSAAGAQVQRSAVAVNMPLPALVPGGQALVEFSSLNVDAWQAALQRFQKTAPPAAPGATAAALPFDGGYLPQDIRLKAQELVTGQRRLSRMDLRLSRLQDGADSTWRANIDAEQAAGYVEYREPRRAGGAGRVYARLTRLNLPPSDAASVETLLDQAPASVPALDVVIDDFELRGKKLGRVELEAVNRGVASGDAPREPREWRLTKLKLVTPEAQLNGSGLWTAPPGSTRRRMVMDFKLDLADSGALLERLGFGRVVKGGKGRMQGQVAWVGSPLALDIPTLDGQMNLTLDAGQFLKADAGAARLLGVLSLQALPRRLLLDFRDVFQEGFAFDNVAGDLSLSRGQAHTSNLRLRGVQAAVLMEGTADIARETQDLRVVVVPELNAGTASLAYAAINPAVGLGTFLAQWVLRRPLQAANTREFHITGGWADPQVARVQRKPGEAAPDIDNLPSPAAAASSPPSNP
ncbi:TIGR02099 family protein [Burkholderiales bacterium JOSHI_001]|nr:TIGR02099 family protein [Burkholderiales bacterium JOSHI_001]